MRGVGDYVRLGTTVDDAIGEAFDKTAKLLGLGYPGGPQVEKEARRGNPARFALPRPMLGKPTPDFSLSGLKTALRLEAEKIAPISDQDVPTCAPRSSRRWSTSCSTACAPACACSARDCGTPTALVAAGGVAANEAIRKVLHRLAFEGGTLLVAPPPALCTDNGAMIAWAGAERLALGLTDTLDTPRTRAGRSPSLGRASAAQPQRASRSSEHMTFDRIAVIGAAPGARRWPTCARAGRSVTLWAHRRRQRRPSREQARKPLLPGMRLDDSSR